jgi:hypothetical protein
LGEGVSEKFDESEADTARRASSREIVERSKRTANGFVLRQRSLGAPR